MTEKRKPTYDLAQIKATFATPATLRTSVTADRSARALRFSRQDVVDAVQALTRTCFVKSMTTYADGRVWQDVYNVTHRGVSLYVKFMYENGHLLISFKEK